MGDSVQNRNIVSTEPKDKVDISNISAIKSYRNNSNSDSDKEMFDDSSAILNDTTLSEGSLNDSSLSEGPIDDLVEFKEPSLYEKETQTLFSQTKHFVVKKDLQENSIKGMSGKGGKYRNNENMS